MRAILIFCIVLGHSVSFIHFSENPLNHYLYSFHLPAFFFVSGFFAQNKRTFPAFLLQKVRTLLIPYWVFALLSILVFQVLGGVAENALSVAANGTLFDNLWGMIYASGTTGLMKWNLPLWYLPCLFAASLLFYLPEKLLSRTDSHRKKVLLLGGYLVFFLALSALNYYVFSLRALPFGLETAFYLMPFFILGRTFRLLDETITKSPALLFLSLLLLVCGGVLAFVNGRVEAVHSLYSNLAFFYLSAALSTAGLALFCRFLSCKALSYLGEHTLSVLVLHKFPVVALQALFLKLSVTGFLPNVAGGVGIALFSCISSLAVGALFLKFIPWTLGKKKR